MAKKMDVTLYFFYMAMLVIIVGGLKLASEVVVIVLVSVFIATILSAILAFLKRKRIPAFFSYLLVFLLFISVFVFLFLEELKM